MEEKKNIPFALAAYSALWLREANDRLTVLLIITEHTFIIVHRVAILSDYLENLQQKKKRNDHTLCNDLPDDKATKVAAKNKLNWTVLCSAGIIK